MLNDRNVMVDFKPGEYMRKMYILTLRLFETLPECHICMSAIVEFDWKLYFFPHPSLGSKGCVVRVGESTRLPTMWPGIKSWRQRHMWVLSLLLVLSLAPRGFSPGTPAFPCLSQKPTFSNSNSTRISGRQRSHFVDVLPLNHYIFLFIIIFICSSTSDLDSISTALWVIPDKRLFEGETWAHFPNSGW